MTSDERLPDGWQRHDDSGFLGLVGPVLQRWEGDRLVLGFQAGEKHRNRRDVVQGGMLMTLADRAMGSAVRSALGEWPIATIQIDVHFIEPAHLGVFIEAYGTVLGVTASVVFVEGRMTADGRLIATAKGVWKRLRPDRPTA